MRPTRLALALVTSLITFPAVAANPILFVTQVPVPGDDQARQTVTSSFANHLPTTAAAPRGGDLMLCLPDANLQCSGASLRNLTRAAGFGTHATGGFQDQFAIAVRDPAVNWGATRAVFSMVVGAPAQQGGAENYTWQLYEVTNLAQVIGQNATPVIQPVASQPTGFNNVNPAYLSDGSLVFVSDRPRNGAAALYPIIDEYRGQPANSGLWRLDPQSGALDLLEPTPSGSFSPSVDSFGRLVFVRWDHLMQDNQNKVQFAPVDYASESAATTQAPVEIYPEPINAVAGSNLNGFEINQFFPWMLNQDGTHEETLNHIGRHELINQGNYTFTNDPNLARFCVMASQCPGGTASPPPGKVNDNRISNFFQMREDPTTPGRYLGVDAYEFGTHTAGQIVAINAANGGTLLNAAQMTVQYINNRVLSNIFQGGNANAVGHYRDPLPLSDGRLIAAYANTYAAEPASVGSTQPQPLPLNPSTYAFHLVQLSKNATANGDAVAANSVVPGGITPTSGTISYYATFPNPGGSGTTSTQVTLTNVKFWELQPVEVVARSAPQAQVDGPLAAPEVQAFQQVFGASGAVQAEAQLRQFLKQWNLAMVVMRNVTSRDGVDRLQPYDLRVPGGVQTLASNYSGGTIYDLAHMQFFEADQVRGYIGQPGRRTMTRPLNDAAAVQFNFADASNGGALPTLAGAQAIRADGSVAVFVPAQRALTWTSLSPSSSSTPLAPDSPVVRERYWIEFQPGEIRACDGCHGVNQSNQAGQPAATNTPQALIDLLIHWDTIFVDPLGG